MSIMRRTEIPQSTILFKIMHELSVSLNEAEVMSPTTTEYVFSWCDFCRMAVDAYDRHGKGV